MSAYSHQLVSVAKVKGQELTATHHLFNYWSCQVNIEKFREMTTQLFHLISEGRKEGLASLKN